MEKKRMNPYQMLMKDIQEFCGKLLHPKTKGMWFYPKDKLNDTWKLVDLYERTAAAEQLGYDVILISTDKGLEVKYQEKRPEPRYDW